MSALNCRRLDFISLHSLPTLLMEQTLLLQNMFGEKQFSPGKVSVLCQNKHLVHTISTYNALLEISSLRS